MRLHIPAALVLGLALLGPAAPALAQPASTAAATSCPAVVLHQDIRPLITIDLDTATDTQVRLLADQLQALAKAEALTTLPGRLQSRLDGTPEDLRAFLKTGLASSWSTDLRVAVNQALATAGPIGQAAAQTALDDGSADALLAYLDDGRFLARAQDAGRYRTFTDLRTRVTIDLDTATDIQIRLLANQLQALAKAEALTTLPGRLQTRLDGTPEDLRAFLKRGLLSSFTIDLRVAVNQTMPGAGPAVQAAAQDVLDHGGVDEFLAYLNHGLYLARAQDCA